MYCGVDLSGAHDLYAIATVEREHAGGGGRCTWTRHRKAIAMTSLMDLTNLREKSPILRGIERGWEMAISPDPTRMRELAQEIQEMDSVGEVWNEVGRLLSDQMAEAETPSRSSST